MQKDDLTMWDSGNVLLKTRYRELKRTDVQWEKLNTFPDPHQMSILSIQLY